MGVTNRSNVRNPKKVLAIDSVKDIWNETADENTGSNGSGRKEDELIVPFQSKLWGVRMAIQRGYDALYAVQVCLYLLFIDINNYVTSMYII